MGKRRAMKTVNIHANCLMVEKKGVLILGGSGAGKSDLALRLIDEGARLVADDRVELYLARGRLKARAPKSIAGLMEVRGLGVIALPFAPSTELALAVKLGTETRLPEADLYTPPLAGAPSLPLITLNARLPSAQAKVRLALTALAKDLFRTGINPT
jgi:HPr kinase/phosphorylase